MSELVQIDKSDPQITILILNRPEKRNALSVELIERLTAGVNEAATDRVRRVIIIRGNGPSFCAGLDLNEAGDPTKSHASAEALYRMYLAIGQSPLVTIAAAQGGAFGGGAGLLAGCDFAVSAEDLKVGYPEVHRGLVAALVTALLHRQLPEQTVRELVLLGNTLDAKQALEMGLINRHVPAANLLDESVAISRQFCQGAPGAIARSKRLLNLLGPRTLEEDLRIALDFHLQARESTEAAEGMAAFLEKRSPRWGPRPADGV